MYHKYHMESTKEIGDSETQIFIMKHLVSKWEKEDAGALNISSTPSIIEAFSLQSNYL